MEHTPARLKSVLFWFAKAAVSIGLLGVLFTSVDTASVGARISRVDPLWVGLALLCQLVITMLSAWRWQVLLRVQSVQMRLWRLIHSFLVATFANNFLPSNVGGDLVRVADTARFASSTTVAAVVVMTDRIIGLMALLLVASVGALGARLSGVEIPGATYVWLALAVALGISITLVARPRLLSTLPRRLRLGLLAGPASDLSDAITRFRGDGWALLTAFGTAVVIQLLLSVFFLCVAHGLMISLSLTSALVIVQVSRAIQMLPISLNGFGVREATFVYFFSQLGLDRADGLTLSFAGVAIIMLYSLTGAVLLVVDRRRPVAT